MGRKPKLDPAIREKYESLAKQAGLSSEEVKAQMLAENPPVPEDQIEAFLVSFYGPAAGQEGDNVDTPIGEGPAPDDVENAVPQTAPTAAQKPATRVAKKYNAEDLEGEGWKKYEADVAKLDLYKMVDFAEYRVEPIITERYPGLPESPKDMTGIRIVSDKPLHITRITPAHAMEFNRQIRNTNKYYLLA